MTTDDRDAPPPANADLPGLTPGDRARRLTEEILLLLLDGKSGDLEPLPAWTLAYALSGAVLMDLSILNRIDTDARELTLIDPAPLDDAVLDPVLAEIAGVGEARPIRYWLDRLAERSEELREGSLHALVRRGVLEPWEGGFLELARSGSREHAAGSAVATLEGDVRLRVIQCLLGSDIPDPVDVMTICLADACGIFPKILARPELDAAQPRLELVRRMDHIGRAVSTAIWEVEPPPRKPATRTTRPIPEARGLPVVGNGVAMARDMTGFLLQQYRLLGPVFRVRAPGRRYIVLAGPSANQFLNRHGKDCLRSAEAWHGFAGALGAGRVMTGMDGAEHFRLRRAHRDGYARAALENRIDDAVMIARRQAHDWAKASGPVPVVHAMQRIITEQLGTILAGTSPREYLDDLTVFIRTLLMVKVARQRPAMWLWTPRFRHARRRVLELFDRVLTTHLERPGHIQPDLIDDLLRLHESDPQFFPETDRGAAMLGPYIAGLDTVASMCAFMLYALLRHPPVMQRMRREADALFEGGPVTATRLAASDMACRVALETLRLYPLNPAVYRWVANSFEFEGCSIAAGEPVLVATTLPHFLPELFPDPERFDVDRYAEGRDEHKQPGAFAPFGLGTHHCLGAGFAESQMTLTMLTILHAVDLEMRPAGYELRIRRTPTSRPCNRFSLRATARSD